MNIKMNFNSVDISSIGAGGLTIRENAKPVDVKIKELLDINSKWEGLALRSVALDAKYSAISDKEIEIYPCKQNGFYRLSVGGAFWGVIQKL